MHLGMCLVLKGGNAMGKHGESIRILCDALCLLHHQGVNYHGNIENISLSGALINMSGVIPTGILPGDTCVLKLCSDPDVCPIVYNCQVVRLDSTQLALVFIL